MNDFVVAKVCNSRLKADYLKALLETEGIEVFIQADDAGGLLPNLSLINGVLLLVQESDLLRAKKLLDS